MVVMMSRDEILGKIYDLKVLQDQRQKIDDGAEKENDDFRDREEKLSKERQANNTKVYSYLKSIRNTYGISIKKDNRDMGYTAEEYQDTYTYYLDGTEIAWYTEGSINNYIINEDRLKEVTEEEAKNILYNRKEAARKNHIESLNEHIINVDKEIERLEREKQEKIKSRGLLSRLFGKKKFNDSIVSIECDIEKLKNRRKRLLEDKEAYKELVVFVGKEEVEKFVENHNTIVRKLKELCEENRKIAKEKSKLSEEKKTVNERWQEQKEQNTTKQKEILKELVDPNNVEVLQEIANDPKYGKDINEVAKKVLRAAGVGERKVKI